ncbi:MAG: ATP-binding protein [Phormidesmis sp.]
MGSIIMSLAIVKTRQITALLKRDLANADTFDHHTRNWQFLSTLMLLFLFGYCLAVHLIAFQKFQWLPLLTGTVFFFGALFVLFSVNIYSKTLRHLISTQNNYCAERDRVAAALKKLEHVKRTQVMLIHNEKMLSLGQLSAGIAHEINNPVSFIYSNLSHVKQYALDLFSIIETYSKTDAHTHPEVVSLLEEIDLDFLRLDFFKALSSMETGTQRILKIVKSVRNFSRLDESQYKQADLLEDLESTLAMLGSRLTDEPDLDEIQIVKHYQKLPPLDCDHAAINQVLLQILNNAIDAFLSADKPFKQAQPKIRIDVRKLDDEWVQLQISDNGKGMSDGIQHHIFDPFFTTKPVGQGTGLGLSISHQIVVEQHSGKIYCHSQEGKRTSFTIELPIRRPQKLGDRTVPRAKAAH